MKFPEQFAFQGSQMDLHENLHRLLLFSLAREAAMDVLQRMRRRVQLQNEELRLLRERELMQQHEEERQKLKLQKQRESHTLLVNKVSCIRQDLQLCELLERFTQAGRYRRSSSLSRDGHEQNMNGCKVVQVKQNLHLPKKLPQLHDALHQQKQMLLESVALLESHWEEAEKLQNAVNALRDELTKSEVGEMPDAFFPPELLSGDADLLAVEERIFALEAEVEASLRELPALEGVQQQLLQQAVSSIPDSSGNVIELPRHQPAVSATSPPSQKPHSAELASTRDGQAIKIQEYSNAPLAPPSNEPHRVRHNHLQKPFTRSNLHAEEVELENRPASATKMNTTKILPSIASSTERSHERFRAQSANSALSKIACRSKKQISTIRSSAGTKPLMAKFHEKQTGFSEIAERANRNEEKFMNNLITNAFKKGNQPAEDVQIAACPASERSHQGEPKLGISQNETEEEIKNRQGIKKHEKIEEHQALQYALLVEHPSTTETKEERQRERHTERRREAKNDFLSQTEMPRRAPPQRFSTCIQPCRNLLVRRRRRQILSRQILLFSSERKSKEQNSRRRGGSRSFLISESERNDEISFADVSIQGMPMDSAKKPSADARGKLQAHGDLPEIPTFASAASERLPVLQRTDDAEGENINNNDNNNNGVCLDSDAGKTVSSDIPKKRFQDPSGILLNPMIAVAPTAEKQHSGFGISPAPLPTQALPSSEGLNPFNSEVSRGTLQYYFNGFDRGRRNSLKSCCVNPHEERLSTSQASFQLPQQLTHANLLHEAQEDAILNSTVSWERRRNDASPTTQQYYKFQEEFRKVPSPMNGSASLKLNGQEQETDFCVLPTKAEGPLAGEKMFILNKPLAVPRHSADEDLHSSVGSGDNSPLLLSM